MSSRVIYVRPSIRPSVCPSIHPSVRPSIRPSVRSPSSPKKGLEGLRRPQIFSEGSIKVYSRAKGIADHCRLSFDLCICVIVCFMNVSFNLNNKFRGIIPLKNVCSTIVLCLSKTQYLSFENIVSLDSSLVEVFHTAKMSRLYN